MSSYPDNFSSRAYVARFETPDLTPDQQVMAEQITKIERARMILQAAIETAEPAVQDAFSYVLTAVDGRESTGEEIEDMVRRMTS